MKLVAATLAVFVASLTLADVAGGQPAPDTSQGEALFKDRCKACHEPAVDQAPTREMLAAKTPDEIVAALTTGPMTAMADGLTPEEMRAIAAYLVAKR